MEKIESGEKQAPCVHLWLRYGCIERTYLNDVGKPGASKHQPQEQSDNFDDRKQLRVNKRLKNTQIQILTSK